MPYVPPAAIQFTVSIYELEGIEDRVPRKVIMRFKDLETPFHLFQRVMLDRLGFDFNDETNAMYYRTAPRFGWHCLKNQYTLTVWVLLSWWFHESSLM